MDEEIVPTGWGLGPPCDGRIREICTLPGDIEGDSSSGSKKTSLGVAEFNFSSLGGFVPKM